MTVAKVIEALKRDAGPIDRGGIELQAVLLRLGHELPPVTAKARPDIVRLLDCFNKATANLFEAFGYVEGYRVFPVEDASDQHWMIFGDSLVAYSPEPFTQEGIISGESLYTGHVYTQRHLSKWIYRTETHTMVLVDTRCDLNILLMVFDNANECCDPGLRATFEASDWR